MNNSTGDSDILTNIHKREQAAHMARHEYIDLFAAKIKGALVEQMESVLDDVYDHRLLIAVPVAITLPAVEDGDWDGNILAKNLVDRMSSELKEGDKVGAPMIAYDPCGELFTVYVPILRK